jgi:hypothetical protein
LDNFYNKIFNYIIYTKNNIILILRISNPIILRTYKLINSKDHGKAIIKKEYSLPRYITKNKKPTLTYMEWILQWDYPYIKHTITSKDKQTKLTDLENIILSHFFNQEI